MGQIRNNLMATLVVAATALSGCGVEAQGPDIIIPVGCRMELANNTAGLNFGDVEVGDVSSAMQFSVQNTGDSNCLLAATVPDPFVVELPQAIVTPGSNVVMEIVFAPTQIGVVSDVVTLSDNASVVLQVAVAGNGVAAPVDDDDSAGDDDVTTDDDDSSDDDDITEEPTPEPELEGDDEGECEDGADNDVDGLFDCADPDCFGSPDCAVGDDDDVTLPVDTDGDGWENVEDCQPGDPNVYPGAPELCNGQDDDCDGAWDEGCPPAPELEGDEAGECEDGADNDVDGDFDCDDSDCFGSPDCVIGDDDDVADDDDSAGDDDDSAGDDDDSSGDDDSAAPLPDDTDGDGWIDTDDCAPMDPTAYPGAVELCSDGVDQDCNGSDLVVDLDGDGYQSMVACALNGDDCDDTEAGVHPFAPEVCGDGIDQDCWSGADDLCTSACDRQIVGSYAPASGWDMFYDDIVGCWNQVGVSVCGLAATITDVDVVAALYGLQQAVLGVTPTNQWVQSEGFSPLYTLEYLGDGSIPLIIAAGGASLSQGTLITWPVDDPAWSCKGAYAEPFGW